MRFLTKTEPQTEHAVSVILETETMWFLRFRVLRVCGFESWFLRFLTAPHLAMPSYNFGLNPILQ